MKTNIVDQAKRLVVLLKEFDEYGAYCDDDQDKVAMLIGARLLNMESELRAIGRYIDPAKEDLSVVDERTLLGPPPVQ